MNETGERNRARWMFFSLCLFFSIPVLAQLAPVDPWDADIRAFEQADLADPPEPGGVLFIGSSSIRFWDSLQADFPATRIIRRGFGGSEIRDATRLAARIVLPYRPRLIVMYAGDNDLAAGRTAQQVRDDFAAFVSRVRSNLPEVRIDWITIKPSPARANLLEATRAANGLVARYAKSQSGVRVIDVFTPMLDADGQPRAGLFGEDGLHMNRAGYRVWIETIRPFLAAQH